MRDDIIVYIIIVLMCVLGIKMYMDSEAYNLVCVISDVNGKKYCIRERENVSRAADKLARATMSMQKLVDYSWKTYPDKECIKRLKSGFNPANISETLPTSQFTAYSENKGEKLAFCLNNKKDSNKELIDDNTLIFVAIHELSHIATKSIGHDSEFWTNFKFLLKIAKEIGIYIPVDYSNSPQNYCGMVINDNPYYT
jgi:hypothetical protein